MTSCFACILNVNVLTIGHFLYNNYVKALGNILALSYDLAHSMKVLKIPSNHTFIMWQEAECEYLMGLKREPELDILHIEYLETLIKLKTAK